MQIVVLKKSDKSVTSNLVETEISPKAIGYHRRLDIVNHIVKKPDTKTEEIHVSVPEDNISSFGYIMLSSQELADLKNALPGASETTESLSNRIKIIPIHEKTEAYWPNEGISGIIRRRKLWPASLPSGIA